MKPLVHFHMQDIDKEILSYICWYNEAVGPLHMQDIDREILSYICCYNIKYAYACLLQKIWQKRNCKFPKEMTPGLRIGW